MSNELTKAEAIQAMKEGKKVTHHYFSDNEFIKLAPCGRIETEEGYLIAPYLFWLDRKGEAFENGWFIFNT